MGVIKRLIYMYPGVHRIGVAAVVMDDHLVRNVSLGSIERGPLIAMLDAFKPDELVVAIDKFHELASAHVPVPDTITKFRYAHPGWAERKVPMTDRASPTKGVYAHNVWKLFFDDCLRRGKAIITHLNVEEFNADWVESNRPRGVRR